MRPRGRRRLPGLGGVVSSLAVLVALVIAGGALVLLHHAHTGSGSTVAVAAARGEILDPDGNVLVGDRPVYEIQINPAALPSAAAARASEYALLARLIGASVAPVGCSVPGGGVLRLAAIECAVAQQARALALATVATDVSPRVVAAVSQDKADLSGVSVKRVFRRAYPYGSRAAQVFGTVGPITAAETHNASDKGVPRTANVGQSGLEYGYDSALRDGDSLRTSLNVRLQKAGEAALARAISQNPPATGGAFVAMNPQNGEVYAIGSAPTFNSTIFAHRSPRPATRR